MTNFNKDLTKFIGTRIDSDKTRLMRNLIEEMKINYHNLNNEEIDNINEAIEKEAIYLCGFADGIRLGLILVETGKKHILEVKNGDNRKII